MYGETPYMGSRLVKGLKKKPPMRDARGLCYVESKSKKHLFFYTLQLVTPSVVAMAVRKEIAICKIVFQVFAFIIFIFIFNVKC